MQLSTLKGGVVTMPRNPPTAKLCGSWMDGPVSFFISSSCGASVLRCMGSSNAASLSPKLAYPVVSSFPQHLYQNKLPDRKGSIQKILHSHFPVKIFLKYDSILLLQCLILTICLHRNIQLVS